MKNALLALTLAVCFSACGSGSDSPIQYPPSQFPVQLSQGETGYLCTTNCNQPDLCNFQKTEIITGSGNGEEVSMVWVDSIIGPLISPTTFNIQAVYENAQGTINGTEISVDFSYDDICRTGHQTPTCSDVEPLKTVVCETATFEQIVP